MYHERQQWALCGVHAINNLLQKPAFDKASFDAVCDELAPSSTTFWNPHRSALGLGNYDVNVLMVVLERQGFTVQWHDTRQEITTTTLRDYFSSDADNHAKPKICGIVVNLPSTGIWSTLTRGRHWMTLLYSDESSSLAASASAASPEDSNAISKYQWMNLDSELKKPEIIGGMSACAKLLQGWQETKKGNCHILLVRK